jgi:Cu2+-containing amine oxidase
MEKNMAERIKNLEKQYSEEWLLVEVTKEDRYGNPVEGNLLEHNPVKENVVKKSKKLKADLALFYSGKIPKKGYAFCFSTGIMRRW